MNITFTAKTPDEIVLGSLLALTLIVQKRDGEEAAHKFVDKAISIINGYKK